MFRKSRGSFLFARKSIRLLVLFFVLMLLVYPKHSVGQTPNITTEFFYFDYEGYTQVDYPSEIMVLIGPELPTGFGYEGCLVYIMSPNDSLIILDSNRTDHSGSIFFTYWPVEVGNHYLRSFYYPGGIIGDDNYAPLTVSLNQYLRVGSEADNSPPEGSVVVNGGEAYVDSQSVVLTFTVQDQSTVDAVYVSNDNINWSMAYKMTWFRPELDVRTTLTWDLTVGDGEKNVYVRFVDAHGLESNYFDTIILDTTPPSGGLDINNNNLETNSTEVTLSLTAEDTLSGVSQMRFSNEDLVWSSWEAYNAQKTWTLSAGDGDKRVSVQFQDNAGNLSPIYSDTITLNTTIQPEPVYTLSISLSSTEIDSDENVTVIGSLSPALSGTEVSIQYRTPGGQWQTIQKITTGDTGEYEYLFPPPETGSLQIRACCEQFLGNQLLTSNSLELTINGPTEPIDPIIIGGLVAAAVITVGSVVVAVSRMLDSLRQAANALEKSVKAISEGNYEAISEQLSKTGNQISKAVASGKLPEEILAPPYSLVDNINQIGDVISTAVETGDLSSLLPSKEIAPYLEITNLQEFLNVSEIKPYLDGAKRVIETYRKIKDFVSLSDALQQSKSKYCVTFISSFPLVKDFSAVMHTEGKFEKDFWFRWKGDVEPVKVIREEQKAVMALYRFHWRHFFVKPYLDEENRIHVFFPPHFHTPIVRLKHLGILFAVFVNSFQAQVYDDYKLESMATVNWFRRYYASKGWKTEHKPDTYYEGWPHANRSKTKSLIP